MKKGRIGFLLLLSLGFAVTIQAADLNGRWMGEAVIGGGSAPVHFNLVQQGNVLKGTGGPSPAQQDPIQNGKIDGKKIVFDLTPGMRAPLHFEVAWDGEFRLKGTVTMRHEGQAVTGQVVLRKRTN